MNGLLSVRCVALFKDIHIRMIVTRQYHHGIIGRLPLRRLFMNTKKYIEAYERGYESGRADSQIEGIIDVALGAGAGSSGRGSPCWVSKGNINYKKPKGMNFKELIDMNREEGE